MAERPSPVPLLLGIAAIAVLGLLALAFDHLQVSVPGPTLPTTGSHS